MKKILFPTDFSPAAENAFVYALALAKKIGAKITVLHAYKQKNQSAVESELPGYENLQHAAPKLREIAESHQLGAVEINFTMEEEETIPAIVRTAKAENSDMVVMGTKGATGLKEVFLGSVTSGVMSKLDTILLAVPEHAKFEGDIRKIIYMIEYRDDERDGLTQVINFAKLFGAEIHCIHFDLSFTDVLSGIMQRWKSGVASQYQKIHYDSIISTDVAASANDYCLEHDIDIAVLLPRKMSLFKKFFSASMSRRLVNHLNIPLLIISNTRA